VGRQFGGSSGTAQACIDPSLPVFQTGFIDFGDKWIIHGTRCGVLRDLVENEIPGLYKASERLIAP